MNVQELHFTSQTMLVARWRSLAPQEREGVWEQLRQRAAEYAAADGKVLTGTPGTRQVLYQRSATGPEGVTRAVECAETEAESVKLLLSCWAGKQ